MAVAGNDYPTEKTLTLRKPVTHAGETISELTLREPTAGEMKGLDSLRGQDYVIKLVAISSGTPLPTIEKLVQRDVLDALEFVTGFWNAAPEIGA